MAGSYHLRICSSKDRASFNLRELWDFRGLLAALAILQLLFYASPVAYQASAVPEKWRGLFLLNPLVPLGLRWGLLREGHFRGLEVAYSLFVATFTLVFGLSFFGVPNGNLRMSCCVR
jgi:ABC-type polysaccharide/polyol phosphate export permease